ncbi:MAG: hypothetical protein AAGD25_10280 [Cyanobacteria bacterium P01_F01_bin.150]
MTSAETTDLADNHDDVKVHCRIPQPYGKELIDAAEAAGVSISKMARRCIVANLENPTAASLLSDISLMTAEIRRLQHDLEGLQNETVNLRNTLMVTTTLLLVMVGGLSPDEAQAVMIEVLCDDK